MRILRIIFILLLIILLVFVRVFETTLFYDPLKEFFLSDHNTKALPEFNLIKLLLHTAFRFVINSILSLLVLWFVFRNKSVVKIAAVLFGGLFVFLILAYIVLLNTSDPGNHMMLFYVRRFLIQPIFLLILLPAFYFKEKKI